MPKSKSAERVMQSDSNAPVPYRWVIADSEVEIVADPFD